MFKGGLTDPWAAPILSPCCKRMVRGTRMMRGEGEGRVGPVNEGREARRRLPERGPSYRIARGLCRMLKLWAPNCLRRLYLWYASAATVDLRKVNSSIPACRSAASGSPMRPIGWFFEIFARFFVLFSYSVF